MAQFDWGTMLTSDDGLDLAANLNGYRTALNSTHKGNTPPAYAIAGLQWIDDSASPWTVKIFDGAQWIGRYKIDPTNHIIRLDPAHLIPQTGSTPTPTALGEIWYDTNRPRLLVGDGAATQFYSLSQWQHISKGIVSAVATFDFTNLSAYRMLRLSYEFACSTTAVNLGARISTDNGGSFISTSTYNRQVIQNTGAVLSGTFATATVDYFNAFDGINNDANRGIWGITTYYNFNQATDMFGNGNSGYWADTAALEQHFWAMRFPGSTARNALRILVTAGTFTGWYALEGIKG